MKKKSIAIGIALVIVAVVVALMSFTNKPVEKTVAVNVYKGGEVVETSTIRIAGNIKNSFLTSECSFVGTFAIEYCENLCRDGVEAKIEWGDGYQSILFFYAGDFTNFNVSKIEIDRQMDSIIVYLEDGTIVATPESGVAENLSATETPSTPTILSVSDLEDVLGALDLTDASLTYHGDTDETYSANAAIRSESYIEALKNLTWKEYVPTSELDKNNAYSYQLTTPDATITAVLGKRDTNGPLHLITDVGEGWFIHSYTDQAEQIKQNWLTYDIFASWHTEAGSALRYGGAGIPLTAKELDFFEEYTEGTWTEYNAEIGGYHSGATQISCFFTSRYSDPRDMDANAFLAYCPGEYGLTQEDEEEFLLVQKKVDWRVGADNHLATFDEFPAPCLRISRTYLNGILMKYAGITVEEMHTDWTKEAFYISETDCFYTFTSDFGPGTFYPYYGEKNGDIVTLWENPCEDASMLTLKKSGENWHILAHQPAIYHFTAEVVKYGNDALCVKVMDAGDSTLSIGDELYVGVRDGYDNYPIGCSVEVAYSGNVTVYDDGTCGPDKTLSVGRVQ